MLDGVDEALGASGRVGDRVEGALGAVAGALGEVLSGFYVLLH
jgi:hypothetical protein